MAGRALLARTTQPVANNMHCLHGLPVLAHCGSFLFPDPIAKAVPAAKIQNAVSIRVAQWVVVGGLSLPVLSAAMHERDFENAE